MKRLTERQANAFFLGISDARLAQYTRALLWCRQEGTGFLPHTVQIIHSDLVTALEERGLVSRAPDGVFLHPCPHLVPPSEENQAAARRDLARLRKARQRARQRARQLQPDVTPNRVTTSVTTGPQIGRDIRVTSRVTQTDSLSDFRGTGFVVTRDIERDNQRDIGAHVTRDSVTPPAHARDNTHAYAPARPKNEIIQEGVIGGDSLRSLPNQNPTPIATDAPSPLSLLDACDAQCATLEIETDPWAYDGEENWRDEAQSHPPSKDPDAQAQTAVEVFQGSKPKQDQTPDPKRVSEARKWILGRIELRGIKTWQTEKLVGLIAARPIDAPPLETCLTVAFELLKAEANRKPVLSPVGYLASKLFDLVAMDATTLERCRLLGKGLEESFESKALADMRQLERESEEKAKEAAARAAAANDLRPMIQKFSMGRRPNFDRRAS